MGPGTVLGPVIGTAAFMMLEEVFWANFLDYNRAILGAVIVILIFFLPGGLLALSYRDLAERAASLFRGRRRRHERNNPGRGPPEPAFGGIQAIDDLSFALKKGEIVALIGPNGAGKTTLVNLMTGVHQPASGRIRFEGVDVTTQRPFEAARRGLARTFQIVQPFPRMTVLENVAAGALFGGKQPSVAAAMEIAREQLEFTGLAQFADRPASALTLAGRKRLELAKSMAMGPKVLMLDEVNAGLNSSEIDGALAADPADRRARRDHPDHRAPDESRDVARPARPGAAPRPTDRRRQRRRDRSEQARWSKPIWARNLRAGSPEKRPVPEPILTIEGLSAGYGDVRVLWDISLSVEDGEIACIVGSNGAGKTTLLRTISGLVPATSGRIRFAGKDITSHRRRSNSGARRCARPGGTAAVPRT